VSKRCLIRLSDEALEIPGNCQNTKTLFDNQDMLARVLEAVARAVEAVARAQEAVARAPEAVARVPRISLLLLL
jgi:ABC-type nitrate/sulfonate/bicarbonate transport system substrate-binding protein